MNSLTTKQIQEIIPHRHPFLLVDTVTECEPGQRAVGYKCVTYKILNRANSVLDTNV